MTGSRCSESIDLLLFGAAVLGLDLPTDTVERFEAFCSLLLEENEKLNLTAIRSPEGVVRTLFLDSLTVLPALPREWRNERRSLVDVGAGAGFPGIPIKLAAPFWEVTLVESVGKKARFLERAVRCLSLEGIEVIHARAEEVGRVGRRRDRADAVVARAVASLPALIELCAPLASPGALLLFPKSGPIEGEVADARLACASLRVRPLRTERVSADLGLGPGRLILVYEKIAPTPPAFPRRVGLATSRPLGGAPRVARAESPRAPGGSKV